MKIVITSQGGNIESPVDPRFGRAAWFLVYDSETGGHRVLENTQSASAAQGAGIKAAETISHLGAEVVITGHCGPKAFHTLRSAGIQVVLGAEGTIAGVLEGFKSGRLKPSSSPDVDGHWQ
jgi:predicted Fe-Mo cluster-binding NifX family protein